MKKSQSVLAALGDVLSEGTRLPYTYMMNWGSAGLIQCLEWTLARAGLYLGDILGKEFQV